MNREIATRPDRFETPIDVIGLRSRFAERLAAVEAAAREWGVRPDYPEGVFVSAMINTQGGFAELALSLAEAMQSIIAEARAVADEELRRQRVATAETKDATKKAREAVEGVGQAVRDALAKVETQKQEVFTTLPDRMALEMIRATRGELLSRYALLRTTVQWGASFGIGVVMIALVLCGYVWGTWSDWGMTSRIQAVSAAVERCRVLPKWHDDKGHPLCEIGDFVER